MSSYFSGKVCWITGASSGIGEALVHALAKQNAKIILSARNAQALEKVAASAGLHPDNFLVIPFDLADTSRVKDYAVQVISKFSKIDFLINNGGFSQRSEALLTEEKVERQLMEVNYFAHVALSKAVLPYMIAAGHGHITVVSSIAGKFGFFLRSSYSAAKHALHGYFESLRLENEKHKIRVLLVCPGKIRTAISVKASTESGAQHGVMDETHKDAMSPEECARQILEAIRRKKLEVMIGGKEIRAVAVKRFFPSVFHRLIRRQTPF